MIQHQIQLELQILFVLQVELLQNQEILKFTLLQVQALLQLIQLLPQLIIMFLIWLLQVEEVVQDNKMLHLVVEVVEVQVVLEKVKLQQHLTQLVH
jgi:hypothetical protein